MSNPVTPKCESCGVTEGVKNYTDLKPPHATMWFCPECAEEVNDQIRRTTANQGRQKKLEIISVEEEK